MRRIPDSCIWTGQYPSMPFKAMKFTQAWMRNIIRSRTLKSSAYAQMWLQMLFVIAANGLSDYVPCP